MENKLNILVMGGSRFFGKRLVELLVEDGHAVTIATRGNVDDGFGDAVTRVTFDRTDRARMAETVGEQAWDVVYDQICYAPTDAASSVKVFGDKIGRYIFTSSLAVYDQNKKIGLVETDFDGYSYPVELGTQEDYDYAEGKRLAEAVLLQRANFPVVTVRFPIVLGPDDYTKRLYDPVAQVKRGEVLKMAAETHEMSLISSAEAADFLRWLATAPVDGPFNACSNGSMTPTQIVRLIEAATLERARFKETNERQGFSIINLQDSWTMNTGKAQAAGYTFANLEEWLRPLIEQFAAELNGGE